MQNETVKERALTGVFFGDHRYRRNAVIIRRFSANDLAERLFLAESIRRAGNFETYYSQLFKGRHHD